MKKLLLWGLCGLLLQPALATASPITIDTTGSQNSAISYFGEPNTATYGQTFTLSSMATLTDFTFFVNDRQNSTIGATNFAAYLMAWDSVTARATGPVLFQSGNLSSANAGGFEQFTINTGSLLLDAGQYVAFFNLSNNFDGTNDAATFASVSGSSAYAGGAFVFLNNGNNFGAVTTNQWSTNWECQGCDLSFRLNATAVPEPTTLSLLGAGLATAAVRRRRAQRRNRSSNC